MNYKDLKNVAEARNILIKDLAERLGMTPNGFKVSIETEKFPIGKVKDLCGILQITITEFFGEEPVQAPSVASERVLYSFNAVPKNGTTPTTVETLVSHIAWLQDEIDRLRSSDQKGKKSA